MFVGIALLLVHCGIPLGSNAPNDPTPSGTIVAHGTFATLNGDTASGNATIYRVNGANFVVRLEGISMPSQGGLLVKVLNGRAVVLSTALRSSEGSQNYSFNVASPGAWNSVDIYSSTSASNVSQALLTSTLPPGS